MKHADKTVTEEERVFRVFAMTYPHETYDIEPVRFCEFFRSCGYNMSDEQIGELINYTRIGCDHVR